MVSESGKEPSRKYQQNSFTSYLSPQDSLAGTFAENCLFIHLVIYISNTLREILHLPLLHMYIFAQQPEKTKNQSQGCSVDENSKDKTTAERDYKLPITTKSALTQGQSRPDSLKVKQGWTCIFSSCFPGSRFLYSFSEKALQAELEYWAHPLMHFYALFVGFV